MSTETTTHPIPAGAIARITRESRCRCVGKLCEHQLFEVEGYVPADESEDGKAYYFGWHDDIGSLEVDAELVALDMTPAQVAERKIPTAEDIVAGLDVLVDVAKFRTTEAESLPDGKAIVYGQTDEGLRFSFIVTVSDVTRI